MDDFHLEVDGMSHSPEAQRVAGASAFSPMMEYTWPPPMSFLAFSPLGPTPHSPSILWESSASLHTASPTAHHKADLEGQPAAHEASQAPAVDDEEPARRLSVKSSANRRSGPRVPSTVARLRHRRLDADRRRGEALLIERLNGFSVAATDAQEPLHSNAVDPLSRDRLSVLRATVDHLQQLSALIAQLSVTVEANGRLLGSPPINSSGQVLQAFSPAPDVNGAHSSASSSVSTSSITSPPAEVSTEQTLFWSGFASASIALLVLDPTTGCCADVNEHWLQRAGWTRAEVLHKLFIAPYEVLMRYDEGAFVSPCQRGPSHGLRYTTNRPTVNSGSRRVLAQAVEQYPKTARLLQQLYRGEQDSAILLWRWRMADGVVREQKQLAWVSRQRRVVSDVGDVEWRPQYLVLAAAWGDEAVVVDE